MQIVIDFDSTLVRVEALDELAQIALLDSSDRSSRVEEIKAITRAAMEGKIPFSESLTRRLKLFSATKDDLAKLTELLLRSITPSVAAEKAFIRDNRERIYIISGGFKEYIVPVATSLGVSAEHVLANSFEFDGSGKIIGLDSSCLLSQENGKETTIRELTLEGPVVMVGDGYSDYLVRKSGEAEMFVAFTENEYRPSVVLRADKVAKSFHEVVESLLRLRFEQAMVNSAD